MSVKNVNLTERLVFGAEKSSFVVIVSSIRLPAKKLFDAFVHNDSSNACLLLTNSETTAFVKLSNLTIYDYFKNNEEKKLGDFFNSLSDDHTSIFIDSLTPLFMLNSNSSVCKLLLDLKRKYGKLVCTINKDCISEINLESVTNIASTIIDLTSMIDNRFIVEVTHKKPNARTSVSIVYSEEHFILSDHKITYCKPKTTNVPMKSNNESEIAIEKLPFNLTLRDEEKEQREKLVMPYTKVQTTNSCKVYYEPDKNDDIDEEDPDDDLDF